MNGWPCRWGSGLDPKTESIAAHFDAMNDDGRLDFDFDRTDDGVNSSAAGAESDGVDQSGGEVVGGAAVSIASTRSSSAVELPRASNGGDSMEASTAVSSSSNMLHPSVEQTPDTPTSTSASAPAPTPPPAPTPTSTFTSTQPSSTIRTVPIVSFSHYLPKQQLLPEKRNCTYPNLSKMVGSKFLADRVDALQYVAAWRTFAS